MDEPNTKPNIYTELADGTILNASCGFDGESGIWIWMSDKDDPVNNMAAMFTIFSDPKKTATIISNIRGIEEVYEGYTKLTILQVDYNGCVHIQMKKG